MKTASCSSAVSGFISVSSNTVAHFGLMPADLFFLTLLFTKNFKNKNTSKPSCLGPLLNKV